MGLLPFKKQKDVVTVSDIQKPPSEKASFFKDDFSLEDLFYQLLGPRVKLLSGVIFPVETRRRMYRDLTHLLSSGLQFRRIFEELSNVFPSHKIIFSDIARRMDSGVDPASAMEGWVPDGERMLIRAAEQSGKTEKMVQMLNRLVEIMDMSRKIKSAFFEALIQPALIFYSTILVFVYTSRDVMDQMFKAMNIDPDRLFGPARFYYDLFSFVGSDTGVATILFATIMFPMFLLYTMKYDFFGRKFLDRFPPWSLYRLLVGAGFMYSLAALVSSGQTAKSALVQVLRQSSGYLYGRISSAYMNMGIDGRLSTALLADGYQFPDKEILQRLRLREARGNLGMALHEFSQDWTEDSIEAVKKQANLLNQLSMVLVGLIAYVMTVGLQAITQAATAMAVH